MIKDKDVEKIKNVMLEEQIENEKVESVILKLLPEKKEEVEDEPKSKKQYVIVLSDPNGVIQEEMTGWVVQIPEDESILDTMKLVHASLYDYNASRKGRKNPVEKVGEGLSFVPYRFFKEHNVGIKTKEAVAVVTTNNILPNE